MFILIDKPKGFTSHDVIAKLRTITRIKKIGHAGTLDPLATGLLVVAIGRESTKKLGVYFHDAVKTYFADAVLGGERDTDDATGEITFKEALNYRPSEKELVAVLTSFSGKIRQVPPNYSSKKIEGVRAYAIARRGLVPKLSPQAVEIFNIELTAYRYPLFSIKVSVSGGTYIRALVRDVGRKLGTGAYMADLRRLNVGNFGLENSVKLEDLTSTNWKKYVFTL